jgi:hypothetical protein
MLTQKLLHERWQCVKSHAVDSGNADGPGHGRARLAQALLQEPQAFQNRLAFGVEQPARRSRLDARSAAALHQLVFEAALERPHLLAHGRLRDEVELGGASETPCFHEVTERLQRLHLH